MKSPFQAQITVAFGKENVHHWDGIPFGLMSCQKVPSDDHRVVGVLATTSSQSSKSDTGEVRMQKLPDRAVQEDPGPGLKKISTRVKPALASEIHEDIMEMFGRTASSRKGGIVDQLQGSPNKKHTGKKPCLGC